MAVLDQIGASDMGIDYSAYITEKYGSEAPVAEANNNLTLSQMRGLSYDDELWDKLLDQLVYTGDGLKEINKLLGNGETVYL